MEKWGNCSGLSGDLDEITEEERKEHPEIEYWIVENEVLFPTGIRGGTMSSEGIVGFDASRVMEPDYIENQKKK